MRHQNPDPSDEADVGAAAANGAVAVAGKRGKRTSRSVNVRVRMSRERLASGEDARRAVQP